MPLRADWIYPLLWLLAAAPPLRGWLETSMALHMLVQLPLLAWIGYCIGSAWGRSRPLAVLQSFNAGGITGLLIASFVMLLWMLPRPLDLARLDASIDALKFLSVPVAGIAVALSWQRVPAIARAVVHLEVIATLLRFGWGYLAAEQRLCLAYLAEDQQTTGILLIVLGAAYAVGVSWRPLFGFPLARSADSRAAAP
jgi:hypothetical protein